MTEGLETDLEVVCCEEGAGGDLVWGEEAGARPAYLREADVRWGKVALEPALEALKRYLGEAPVEYVVVGKHNSGKGAKDSPERRFSRAVFEKVPCAVVVLRLPAENVIPGKILVPCAGGTHSRVALRLAHRMGETTGFFVEPDVDLVSREVGERQLAKVLRRAGVEEEVEGKVALGSEVGEEIRKEAETGA